MPKDHPFATKEKVQHVPPTADESTMRAMLVENLLMLHLRHVLSFLAEPCGHSTYSGTQLTPEEEQLLEERLSVRRGAPMQEGGRRGYPGDALA